MRSKDQRQVGVVAPCLRTSQAAMIEALVCFAEPWTAPVSKLMACLLRFVCLFSSYFWLSFNIARIQSSQWNSSTTLGGCVAALSPGYPTRALAMSLSHKDTMLTS